MNYLEKLDWNKVKADLEKGLKQGLVAIKKGALVVKKKAGELSEEGRKQYRIIELKAKAHKSISELGARVYAVMNSRTKNPAQDARVKDIIAQIKKYQSQIASLEKRARRAVATKTKKTPKLSSRLH